MQRGSLACTCMLCCTFHLFYIHTHHLFCLQFVLNQPDRSNADTTTIADRKRVVNNYRERRVLVDSYLRGVTLKTWAHAVVSRSTMTTSIFLPLTNSAYRLMTNAIMAGSEIV